MAETKEPSQSHLSSSSEEEQQQPPLYLEVSCKSSGIIRRFAPGTKASFALTVINSKLQPGAPLALYIQAVKSGEEPIVFGPTSLLLNYGYGWTLQTVYDSHHGTRTPEVSQSSKGGPKKQASEPGFNFTYVGKIVVAFIFIFLLGGIFTFALESLPRLLLYINSSM